MRGLVAVFLLIVTGVLPAFSAAANPASELLAPVTPIKPSVYCVNKYITRQTMARLGCCYCRLITACSSENSRLHLWLGRAYGEKAAHSSWFSALMLAKKTRAEFESAVALNGHNSDARSDLAEFYLEAPAFLGGSKNKAHKLADQARALGAEGISFRIGAAVAEAEKNYALAEQNLQAAIRVTHDPDFILDLAAFYLRRGRLADMDAAVNDAVKAAMEAQSSPVLVGAAELLYSAGRNFRTASQFLRDYISSSRHSADAPLFRAHYLLGSILEKQGEKDAAAEQYRAALALASGFAPARQALRNLQ